MGDSPRLCGTHQIPQLQRDIGLSKDSPAEGGVLPAHVISISGHQRRRGATTLNGSDSSWEAASPLASQPADKPGVSLERKPLIEKEPEQPGCTSEAPLATRNLSWWQGNHGREGTPPRALISGRHGLAPLFPDQSEEFPAA